jgi:AcrR family transcriptional regulator/DNA-binding MarR family transcriptional regulator
MAAGTRADRRRGVGVSGVLGASVSVSRGRAHAEPAPAQRSVPRRPVTEIQRSRLIAAAVRTVEELGYADTTVAQITSRARVSRRTFYELFANREECLAGALEDVLASIAAELAAVDLQELMWRERVRMGLWTILSFFDREPVLARVCIVQASRGGPAVLERREEILACLASVVDEGRLEGTRADLTPLTAEGLVGAAFTIVYARLLKGRPTPLRDLLGELMGMIVLPYQGAAAARREQARPAPAPAPISSARTFVAAPRAEVDPLDGVPMRLTYRTARVLEWVAERPGLSNREIAAHAGITDQGQVSKLLARLERLGLLANKGEGHLKGVPNAWTLTAKGRLVAQNIRTHLARGRQAA